MESTCENHWSHLIKEDQHKVKLEKGRLSRVFTEGVQSIESMFKEYTHTHDRTPLPNNFLPLGNNYKFT